MRTPEQSIEYLEIIIADMDNRPGMYIHGSWQVRGAEELDSLFHLIHKFWAFVQLREKELYHAINEVGKEHYRGPLGFPQTFRERHPETDESAVRDHVLKCWHEIDSLLKIDISNEAAQREFSWQHERWLKLMIPAP
jgi:hypothetical protein